VSTVGRNPAPPEIDKNPVNNGTVLKSYVILLVTGILRGMGSHPKMSIFG